MGMSRYVRTGHIQKPPHRWRLLQMIFVRRTAGVKGGVDSTSLPDNYYYNPDRLINYQ